MSTTSGLGFDATDIPRIAATIERYGDRFVRRIFTTGEIEYCRRRRTPATHFAGRFAAKEAAMKALGTGHSRGVLWRDIEVVRRGGPPQLQLHGGAARRFAAIGGRTSLLTITHSETLALAEVLLLGEGPLEGLKLVGFAIWERRGGGSGRNVTFPARSYAINGERRSYALLRPIAETTMQEKLRGLILEAFQEFEERAAIAS